MIDTDEDAPATYETEVRKAPRLVGTSGDLYSRTITATPGAELLDSAQSPEIYQTPKETTFTDDESNYFKSAQWYLAQPFLF